MKILPGFNNYTAEIDGHRMSFRCRYRPESDEMVVFIHGLACSWTAFRHALEEDRFAHRSLCFVDLIGFGDSDGPRHFSYALQDQARIVDALLTILPQQKLHLAAHSMGGAVALLLSSRTYGRVRSFANIEGNLLGEDCGILSRGISAVSYERYRTSGYPRHVAAFGQDHLFSFEKTTPLAVHRSAVSLVRCSESGELLSRFRELGCSKSFSYGEENQEMAVLNRLDFAEKIMISNSGHAMMVENPAAFYRELQRFIDSV